MDAKLSLVLLCACAAVALAQNGYNYNQPPPAPTNLYEQPSRPAPRPPRPSPPRPAPRPPTNNYGPPTGAANNPVPDRVPAPGPGMEGMPYDFDWGVQDEESGNQFSHVETSDGQTTQGEYRVLLPDGRTQVVTFFDNGGGFNAEVTYEK